MAVRPQILSLLALAACLLLGAGCGKGDSQPLSAEVDDPAYRQGQQFVKQGRTQEALTSFLKVIEKRGGQASAESHLEAGLIYLNHSKDPVEAYHHFRQYLAQQPNSPESKHVRELVDTAKRDFARSLPGQPLDNQPPRSQLFDQVERLTRENEELRAELAALRSGAAAPLRTTRAPASGEIPQVRLTVPAAAAPVIPVEESTPITVAPMRPGASPVAPAPGQVPPTPSGQNARALPSRPEGAAAPMRRHTVAPGDTLYNLTRKYYGAISAAKADAIFEANRDVMKNPGDLRPGMEIKIP
jgi:nucleoid-associated protein YgaU